MDGDGLGHGNMNGAGGMDGDGDMDGDGHGAGGMDENIGVGMGTRMWGRGYGWGWSWGWGAALCRHILKPQMCHCWEHPQEVTHGSALPSAIQCMGGEGSSPPAQLGFWRAVAVLQVASHGANAEGCWGGGRLWLRPITTSLGSKDGTPKGSQHLGHVRGLAGPGSIRRPQH